jgi:hypothetical protein
MPPRIDYANCGDLNIACHVTGEGPLDGVLRTAARIEARRRA